MMKETATTRQVAEALGVAPTTVNAWVRQNIIPFVRLTRSTIRYDLNSVIEALKSRQEKAQPGDGPSHLGSPISL